MRLSQGALVAVVGHPRASELAGELLVELAHRGAEPHTLLRAPDGERDALGVCAPCGHSSAWSRGERFTLALDGALVDAASLIDELDAGAALRRTDEPAELLLQLQHASTQTTAVNRLVEALGAARGGWALVRLGGGALVAARDPNGLRPLSLGRLEGATLVASEAVALQSVGAQGVRELEPGEILIVDQGGPVSIHPFPAGPARGCLQERLRVARVDGQVDGEEVWTARAWRGEALALEQPVQLDAVVPLDAASSAAAAGFARISGKPLIPALLRGGGRAAPGAVSGRRIALVAGSTPPAEALARAVSALRGAGALELHVRLAAPPTRSACPYGLRLPELGVDPDRPDRLRASLRVSSVAWLSARPAQRPSPSGDKAPCDACFSREFPVLARGPDGQQQLPLFQARGTPGV